MSIIPFLIESLHYLEKKSKYTTVKFKVWGNCGKCKTRIENALKTDGIKKAKWDLETKMLTITFNPKLITLEKIHERLAIAGHDTTIFYTPSKKYRNLPECCKYTRE